MKPVDNRNLYTSDCNTYFYNCLYDEWQKVGSKHGEFSPEAIHAFVDRLAQSGVDTFVYNPNTQRAWWPSKTTPTVWDGYRRNDRSFFYGHVLGQPMTPDQVENCMRWFTEMLNRYLDLVEAGVDVVAETAAACRRNKIAPWLSVRMNDMHGANSLEGSFMNAPLLAHEEFRLKGISYNTTPARCTLQALNYAKQEVRDYMFTMIRELIEDYDYEGIELDWTRHLFCCDPVASQETIDTVSDWHRQVADLCRQKAEATGKPYYFGLRGAANYAQMKHIGLDFVGMAQAGFVDFICPTRAGWSTTWDVDYPAMRALVGPDVALYGVVEDAPNWLPAYDPKAEYRHYQRYISASDAMLKGNAAGKLVLGADGIETFNFFCTDADSYADVHCQAQYPSLKGLDDLEALRGQRKYYSFNTGFECWGVRTILEADEVLPQWFEPTTQRRFRIPLCAEPEGMALTIQLILEKPADDAKLPELGVSFNESWPQWGGEQTGELLEPCGSLTHHPPDTVALNYRFPASTILEGWNDIIVAHGADDPGEPSKRKEQGIRLVGIELLVDKAG